MKLFCVSSWGLRNLLMALIGLIFIPVLAILLFTGYTQYRHSLQDIEADAERLIDLFIEEQVNITEQTYQLLKVVSHVPAVRNLDLAACNEFLQSIHQDNPQYSTFVAANGKGIIDCCAIPLEEPIDVTDRSWFQRINESREFVIDRFIISRAAKKASLPFAYPVFDAQGKLQVAVGAAFNLEYYQKIFHNIALPQHSVIMVTDRQSTLLYQSFTEKECLGQTLSDCRGFNLPDSEKGRFSTKDIDGLERSYWFERLSVGQERNEIYLLVGISHQQIFADTRRFLLFNIAMLLIVALLSLSIAWFFGGKFMIHPVYRLVHKAQRVQAGDLTLSESMPDLPGELSILSQAFDEMIVNLSQRERERDHALKGLQKARDELEDRVIERTRQLEAQTIELTKAKDKADAANRAKSEFLSNMSHELRTPLNSILGYAQILRRDSDVSSRQSDGLDIIQQSGEHLLTLINDILDLAKIEAGKLEISSTEFHLPSFLHGIAGIIRMRTDQKDLTFAYEPLSPLPQGIRADETRLRQVLLNLLGNAVKFTDEGHVLLHVSVIEEHESDVAPPQVTLCFEVSDTGAGISPEQTERIFQPFEQVGDGTRRVEGTGLGLAISRQLVTAMGGELQVKSQLEKGSTFWFDIIVPVVTMASEPTVVPERVIVGYTGERRKVLIADDKEYNRLVLITLLEPLGFEIMTAGDGRETIDKARHIRPDVILTDLIMPVMTGFEAVREIRQIPELQHVCIIAVSASVFDTDQQQSTLAGCDDFLPKPVNAGKLFDLLATHLNLEWMYERIDERLDRSQKLQSGIHRLVPPPPEELEVLYNIAQWGNMRRIREQASRIEHMDPKYKLFTDTLQQFAKEYKEEEIRSFLQQYIGEGQ